MFLEEDVDFAFGGMGDVTVVGEELVVVLEVDPEALEEVVELPFVLFFSYFQLGLELLFFSAKGCNTLEAQGNLLVDHPELFLFVLDLVGVQGERNEFLLLVSQRCELLL